MARIRNTDQLQKRIDRTKMECKALEYEFEQRYEYLQHNYMHMATNSAVMGVLNTPKSIGVFKDVISSLWKSNGIKGFLKKRAISIIRKMAMTLGFKLVQNFTKDKAETKEEEETTAAE